MCKILHIEDAPFTKDEPFAAFVETNAGWIRVERRSHYQTSLIKALYDYFLHHDYPLPIMFLKNNLPGIHMTLADLFDENPKETIEIMEKICDDMATRKNTTEDVEYLEILAESLDSENDSERYSVLCARLKITHRLIMASV
ncbi:hypothetical protein KKA15_05930 [Patescibacteria group bacterium]|nr:hypothetical protein [Patescibacteria group bacterium]